MELCDLVSRRAVLFLAARTRYHHYFLPLQDPVYPLFRLLSPARWGPAIFPLPRCSRFPPFSPSRTCVCARAPSDFFPVFTHRSFFPFRNIIDGAMHLSPFPSPPSAPSLPLPSPASPGEGPARSPRESDFGESWTRAGNSLTRGCRRQEALIATISRRLTP